MDNNKIKNLALFELGFIDEIENFTTSTEQTAKIVELVYEPLRLKILSEYNWYFQAKTAYEETPTDGDTYDKKYELPADYLRLRGIFKDKRKNYPILKYEVVSENIECDFNQGIYIEYVSSDAFGTYIPSYFVDYFVFALACKLCMNLTGDTDLLQILEQKQDKAKVLAYRIDGKQVEPKRIRSADKFINLRRY